MWFKNINWTENRFLPKTAYEVRKSHKMGSWFLESKVSKLQALEWAEYISDADTLQPSI